MSAPSMTAKAIESGMRPRPAKEETSSAVAVLDLQQAGDGDAAAEGGETVSRAGGDGATQGGAEGAREPSAHHADAPQQQGHAADDVQDGLDAVHFGDHTLFVTILLSRDPLRFIHEGPHQRAAAALLQADGVLGDREVGVADDDGTKAAILAELALEHRADAEARGDGFAHALARLHLDDGARLHAAMRPSPARAPRG